MAGLDGIESKINPGEALDKDLYHLSKEEMAKVPSACGSLREALAALSENHGFLLKGGVFSKDIIDAFIALKMEEVERTERAPHPVAYSLYFSS